MGSLQERLALLKKKTNDDSKKVSKEGDVFKEPEKQELKEPSKIQVPIMEKVGKPETTKRTRRTKAQIEADKQSSFSATTEDKMPEKLISPDMMLAKEEAIQQPTISTEIIGVPFTKKVLVFIGCSVLDENKNNPSDFLHDKYIQPVLDDEKIPHIACSEFSKANKQVLLFAETILNEIYENYECINIDFRRPVDALVYQMIMDIDVRKNGNRFRLVRSTF